ncbi:MAG TPA: hypothetical protein VES62_05345 [Thermoleophilaceae bacterium]|nr:hypothetical protein [Thermoleophilaceae bacterium]
MGGRSKPAMGTSSERGAYSLLWAAVDRVAAGQAWLHWIDEAGSRGLNARPFKMLAEGWFDTHTATPGHNTTQIHMAGRGRGSAAKRRTPFLV